MNYNDLSRPLDISDVDFRVQSINNGGYATILAYKDARVDMNRLDEVLTPLGWQRDYKLIDGKLFCGVGIWHKDSNQWIWKWDVGTESNTEAEKGQASDAFKRSCFNLGIGRELYDYPIISVKLFDNEWSKEGGKPRQTFNLKIKDWKWYSEFTDGKITFLAAKDENNNVRFRWGQMRPKDQGEEPTFKPASGGTPATSESSPEAPKENPLSSPVETKIDEERDLAIRTYESVFGKKPHHKSSTEKIIQDTEAEISRISAEKLNEEEERNVPTLDLSSDEEDEDDDIPQRNSPSILDFIDEISEFTDPKEFVSWAKEIVSEWQGTESSENINTFKDMCNNHYSKISK